MTPLRLTGPQMREIHQAAAMVPWELRGVYLERLANELRGQGELGDGLVHRVAHAIAREITRTARRTAWG